MAINASDARKRLFPLIQQVNDDDEAVEILSKNGTAFLVSEAQWRSLQETAHLMRSPANARRLMDAIENVESGRVEVHDLIDPEISSPEITGPPVPGHADRGLLRRESA